MLPQVLPQNHHQLHNPNAQHGHHGSRQQQGSRGNSARSVSIGAREALKFGYKGRAMIGGSSQAFSGTCSVDISTSALLDLRLSTPIEV